ncbi:NERD domain-containing protein [Bacillus suaedaesalsae]|uniref:NERD domain-containing protein n=1 Tax=Bacillus suaedaesalsae TaxID=2810349 RepID=A0ABS2DD58_9BACI|nr:NERD domain-containing protein [Bacillus suaedaesalsae]MBM6616390.1 NERD domain-containing protein [Bacillus suaedaesalsae]
MAQLIKLMDFISRYEMNTYRYPSQYIRLKKQHWNRLKTLWEQGLLEVEKLDIEDSSKSEKRSIFRSFKGRLTKNEKSAKEIENFSVPGFDEIQESDGDLPLEHTFKNIPKSEDELKQRFLDDLIEFQIRWASSTIREKSYVDRPIYFDEVLKYFLQRFPDNYLVLYKPVFLVQRAPIELEVIMISPTETWCITLLEGKENSVFYGSKDRFWSERYGEEEERIGLSPMISLNRMEKIVRNIYQYHEVELPIRKVVLNRTGYIDYLYAPVDTMLIDKRVYEEWFSSLRRLSSPLKSVQLKAAKVLLQHCQTTYVKRPEWGMNE